jgi:malate dehydrogenase (quinone)
MTSESVDVLLVGAGIMSTSLGVFLKELKPDLTIEMIERMPQEAQESSGAGTTQARAMRATVS